MHCQSLSPLLSMMASYDVHIDRRNFPPNFSDFFFFFFFFFFFRKRFTTLFKMKKKTVLPKVI